MRICQKNPSRTSTSMQLKIMVKSYLMKEGKARQVKMLVLLRYRCFLNAGEKLAGHGSERDQGLTKGTK
jgi:hypothetical protein